MPVASLRDQARSLGLRTILAGFVAWAAAAAIAFRSSLLSSFDLVFGSPGDGRLIAYLHEHLFNALRGRAEFLSPPFYFPQKNVLGYTDAFLLDILPYSALRALELDAFVASQVLAIALSLVCFVASLVILVRYLGLSPAIAICAAVLITFPNNLMVKTAEAHPNFFALYYVPCIVLLALWAIEDFPRPTKWSLVRAGLTGLLFGLLFSTLFYIAWLFVFTALFALSAVAVMRGRAMVSMVWTNIRPCSALLAAAAIGFAVGIVPLLMIYLPALHELSGRTFREYLSFAPFPKDLINVSHTNLVWGWLVERLLGKVDHERVLAVTPLLTAFVLGLAYVVRKARRPGQAVPWQLVLGIACIAVWALSWLLTLRIGSVSVFWIPYKIVPGAVAIRAAGRIQLLVHLWLVVGLAVLLQHWITTAPLGRLRARQAIAGLLLAVCLVEQINLQPGELSRRDEFARLDAVPAPPADCEVFVVNAGPPSDISLKEVDAMWISMRLGLPTINGNSGWSPPGWRLDDIKMDYDDALRRWIKQAGVTQRICQYQRDTQVWSAYDPTPPALRPTADAAPRAD
ncbi:conserved hypothetical protein [Rhodopseudomonas palustris HaA2]|uniref:Glycosyltransferase RgtA/B/C/D-like domain-containing protein n=1 Tax=Rhodopseudomonas palustris (strain HaA2) TaxID=316058 RepID=Q2IV33_RHOP2|nr:hypothetical protein [Rhodopseudomonas palustris]ABD07927.1 conserved hypothetical protein [Rhodopseudomonas palustris HaA2]